MNPYRARPWLETLEDRTVPSALTDLADVPTYEDLAIVSGDWDDPGTWGGTEEPTNAAGQTETEYYLSWVPAQYLPDVTPAFEPTFVQFGQTVLDPFQPLPGEGGHVPVTGDDVLIPEGVTVTLDSQEAARLGVIRVEGTLRFAPDVNTRLIASDIIVLPTGALEIGTDAAPVTSTAEVRFAPYAPTLADDPTLLGGGLNAAGTVSIVGAATPTWGPEGTLPAGFTYRSTDDGQPLPAGFMHYDYFDSRHITFRDEGLTALDSAHVAFHVGSDVTLRFAQFGEDGNGFGRTRKDEPVVFTATDVTSNVPARYGPHFHRNGSAGDPAVVEGVLVVNPTSWGIVNHSSNVDISDSVVVGAFGSAFQIETAAARGSLTHNLAVDTAGDPTRAFDAGQAVNDLGHSGNGFWVQGTGVVTTDNVSVHSDKAGFVIWGRSQPEGDTGVKSDPGAADRLLAEFARNTAIDAELGFRFFYLNHPDDRATDIRAARVLNGTTTGFGTIDLYNPELYGLSQGYTVGITHPNGYHGYGSIVGGHVEGFATGIYAPREDVQEIDGTTFNNLGADIFLTAQRIDGTITFRNLDAGVKFDFNNGPLQESHYSATPDDFAYLLEPAGQPAQEMFHTWADRDYVPFATGTYAGLTNQQILDQYGLQPRGGLAPLDAVLVGDLSSGYLLAP